MSDTPRGPNWWQASDGKWYPPNLHPRERSAAVTHILRAFTYACAFAGAGFLGLWINAFGWSRTYEIIVGAAVGAAVIVTALRAKLKR